MTDKEAAQVAAIIEEEAYTVARVESQTTSGQRPHYESLKAYVRKLAALLTEWVASEGTVESTAATVGEVIDLTGKREFLTKDGAERALAPLLAGDSAVRRLKLSTKSFGLNPDNSAEVVARAVEAAAKTLTDVDLSDVIAGRPEAEALAALKLISSSLGKVKLQRLDLSDNALGEKGVRACAEAFSNQEGLEFLAFQNVGCSINACAAVRDLLKHPEELRTLHFYNNMSDDDGASSIAEILSRAPAMEDFKMGSSRVGAVGGSALAKGLGAGVAVHMTYSHSGQRLLRLDLSDNPMTAEVAPGLAALITAQPRLRALNLNDTSLLDDGTSVVAHALETSADQLEELELALNEITPVGAQAVAKAIQHKHKLKKLNLRENELGDRGAVSVATGLMHLSSIHTIDLTQNQVRSVGAAAIAKGVSNCKRLEVMALDENEISEDGIYALKETLDAAGLLSALGSLEDNDADAGEASSEAAELQEELSAALAQVVIK